MPGLFAFGNPWNNHQSTADVLAHPARFASAGMRGIIPVKPGEFNAFVGAIRGNRHDLVGASAE
jgi:hypothetical protein